MVISTTTGMIPPGVNIIGGEASKASNMQALPLPTQFEGLRTLRAS